jgi:hypothetical protein
MGKANSEGMGGAVQLGPILKKTKRRATIWGNILNLITFMLPSGMGERYFFDNADIL